MDFSKYKLQKYLAETAPMGSVQVGNTAKDGAKDQIAPTRDRKSVQSRQSAEKPTQRTMSGQMFAQGYVPDYDKYFSEMNAEKRRQREYNEQKCDWRKELITEKAVDGVEREQHPFVTVMPTGDENLIQAMKQMGGEVKDKKEKLKGAAGGDMQEGKRGLWDNIHAKRKRGEAPAKKGDKDYPKTLNVEGKEEDRKDAMPKGDVGHDIHKRAVAAFKKKNPSYKLKEDDSIRDKADFEFKKNSKQKLDLKGLKDALKEAKKSDCKDGYKWDSEKKKCVKKTGSSSTRVYVGGLYPGYGHGGNNDDDDDGDSGGGDGGGDGGGGGMGEMFDYLGDMLLKEKLESGADYHARMKKAAQEPINPHSVPKTPKAPKPKMLKKSPKIKITGDMTKAVGKPRLGSSD